MFFLGIPTTRAGSVVTSDSEVMRDVYYSGKPRFEKCSVVLRVAPTFLRWVSIYSVYLRAQLMRWKFVFTHLVLSRFGSFEIFKKSDEFTGRQGPSYGLDEIRRQMLDYVIEMFYPEIQQNHTDRVERNVAFFREVGAPLMIYYSLFSSSLLQIMTQVFEQPWHCYILILSIPHRLVKAKCTINTIGGQ